MRYEGLSEATVHTAQGDPVVVERPASGQLVFATEAGVTYVIDVSA